MILDIARSNLKPFKLEKYIKLHFILTLIYNSKLQQDIMEMTYQLLSKINYQTQ